MKIHPSSHPASLHQRASAVVVVLAMVAIMMSLVTVNIVAVRGFGRELKALEKKQLKRLKSGPPKPLFSPATNPTHG
jgi:hypothetical protein